MSEPEDEDESAIVSARDRRGVLSIVATPIGNLEDITLRALRTLREADLVLAEDTRRTRVLCLHHGLHCTLRAFHAHSDERAVEQVMEELQQGKHIALVTDAGTPVLSDPGSALVAAVRARGLGLETIPGPSAITAALTVAAVAVDHFRFLGFLPRSGKRRRLAIEGICADACASVLFESPQRLVHTLDELAGVLEPERLVVVCRELTKLHEEVVRGSAREVAQRFSSGVRGEITMVIEGRTGPSGPVLSEEEIDAELQQLLDAGVSAKDAAAQVARETGVQKKAVYSRAIALKGR